MLGVVPAVSAPETKPTVLLIDDSVDVHRLLRARLKHEPIELADAFTGEEGVAMAKATRPGTVLLDLDMPGMDGFQVLRALKAQPSLAEVPVIVLSASAEADDKVTAFDLGASDYVHKNLTNPGDVLELKARLRASLRLERLVRMLAEQANLDGLTGLGNRKSFDRRWAQEVSENQRYGHPLSLAMFDLDHFKSVNDTFGHPAGDAVLQEFAKVIAANCRGTDIPCRFGGEEFVLILPHTAPADAQQVVDRIRTTLEAKVWPRHPERTITVSIGVAGAPAGSGPVTAEQWIAMGDKALYAAKHGGRNRVVVAEPVGLALAKAG